MVLHSIAHPGAGHDSCFDHGALDQDFSPRRAHRYHVSWPARLRRGPDAEWLPCRTVNLSVSGVLLRTHQAFEVGERVEVEIEFRASVKSTSIVSSQGQVVRLEPAVPGGAAISFVSAAKSVH